jgi:hypothetical protein
VRVAGFGRSVAGDPPIAALRPGERVWLDVRGRQIPAVVTEASRGRVRLRIQRSDRWDAVRIVRGRAKAGALVRRESLHAVDGGWRP